MKASLNRILIFSFAFAFLYQDAPAQSQVSPQQPVPQPSPSVTPSPVAEVDSRVQLKQDLSVWASQTTARIVVPPEEEKKVEGLFWNRDKNIPIYLIDEGAEIRLYVDVNGTYDREDWALIHDSKRVEPKKGNFSLRILIEGKATQMEVVAVGPEGELQRQKVYIAFDQWDYFQTSLDKSRQGKRWAISPGLGFTLNLYEQTGIPQYSQFSLTGKISAQYVIRPPNWDIGINAFFTLVPITKNYQEDITVKFLGSNFRIGYVLPFVPEPWRISLQLGYYYITMLVTDNYFGFQNVTGPQIFPSFRRIMSNGDSLMAYSKFSPISKKFNLLQLENREIAVGGGWGSVIKKGFLRGKVMFLTLDLADLILFEDGVQSTSRSATFGMGLGF